MSVNLPFDLGRDTHNIFDQRKASECIGAIGFVWHQGRDARRWEEKYKRGDLSE